MINSSQAQENYNKLKKLIISSRFNESFLLLKNQMKSFSSLKGALDKLISSESTYKYMLDYIADGYSDPAQKDMMEQVREQLFQANDLIYRESILKDSSDIYSSTRRLFDLKQTSLTTLLKQYDSKKDEIFKDKIEESHNIITQTQADIINELFNYVWTMFGNSAPEYDTLSAIFENENYPEYLKSILISAIVLGNLSYYDPKAFEVLLNIYDSTSSINLKAKSAVGIVLLSILYSKRLLSNIHLRSRLILSYGDEDFKSLVNDVLINIIRTYDTKRIDNKMRNEVIPGLMKINPEIINKMRNMASESEDFLSKEGNPEWEEIIENSGIADKLQEINDMQLEGADVMVTAFSNLKGFPFFSQASNWFLPFTPGHYEFASLPLQHDKENIDHLTSVMCDSDLHSFLLSLSTMPEDKKNLMLNNLQNQMNQAFEAMTDSIGETDKQRLSKKIRHNLQDIYRFFKYFRKKSDFSDPFELPFVATEIEPLISLYDIKIDNIKLISEFYFKNKYFQEAASMFELVDRLEPGDINILEKIGYCYERISQFEKAVEWYKKSEILNSDNPWLIKRLAITLKNSGKAEDAITYYEKALSNEPENYHLLMSAGQCLLSIAKYNDALQKFYHAQYLKPEKRDAKRAVAWTELLSKNFDKACSLYEKLLTEKDVDNSDFLNAAHGALASGDFKGAVRLYKSFVRNSDPQGIKALVIGLRDDAETIKQLGIKTSDLRLIVDKIRYDLSDK